MHLNSFNKLVKYLLEANEGVFRYSDLTGEPAQNDPIYKKVHRGNYDEYGKVERVSKEEYEKAKQHAEYYYYDDNSKVKNGSFIVRHDDGSTTRYTVNSKILAANNRLFNSKNYIQNLEKVLERHLRHKITIFLNDVGGYDYTVGKPQSRITVEVPSDVIGLEISADSIDDDDYGYFESNTLLMLTPWMIGHRLGHQFTQESDSSTPPYDSLNRTRLREILTDLIQKYIQLKPSRDNILDIPLEVGKQMFNFKSIKKLDGSEGIGYMFGEFYNELFAQYAKYGKVTIHYPGTSEERAYTARQIEQVFSNWLDTLKGRVTNIDE